MGTGHARKRWAIWLVASAALSACGNIPDLGARDAARGLPAGVTGTLMSATEPDRLAITATRVYRLGAGDELEIRLRGAADPIAIVTVGENGRAKLPVVGDRYVRGETGSDLSDLLGKAREDDTGDPTAVEIVLRNPYDVYVLGEVRDAGPVPYKEPLTLGAALKARGGPTHRAEPRTVLIRPRHADAEIEVPLDPNLPLLPGDIVRLGEQYF